MGRRARGRVGHPEGPPNYTSDSADPAQSVTKSRIEENFQLQKLEAEDIEAIDAIGKNPKRYNVPKVTTGNAWTR